MIDSRYGFKNRFKLGLGMVFFILAFTGLYGVNLVTAQVYYYADLQLIDPVPNPNNVLPPGPDIENCRAIIDTGSPVTLTGLACSRLLGLGTVAGTPAVYTPAAAFRDPTNPSQVIGGVGGAARRIARTRALEVNAGGLGRDLVRYQTVSGIHVLHPLVSIVGTDFFTRLPRGQSLMIRRDGSATFFGSDNSPSSAFEMRSGPFEGTGRWVFPAGTVNVAGPAGSQTADFAIVTGAGYTIIGRSLAARLGLAETETITLDEDGQAVLALDGFIAENTRSLAVSALELLQISTDEGDLSNKGVRVLINPDSDENLLGAGELFFHNDAVRFDTEARRIFFSGVELPPTP